jgi:two-component system, cell cycle sensor histidine kinase and response regulator CckA
MNQPGKERLTLSNLRKEAEKRLKERLPEAETISTLTREEMEGLLHDLSVHHIELEIQNEELLAAQNELQELNSRYVKLYDLAPVGYVTTDERDIVIEANLAFAGLLGVERTSLIGKHFNAFVDPSDQGALYVHRQRLVDRQTTQTCDITVMREDGSWFNGRLQSVPLYDSNGQHIGCRSTITDITERKQAEEALRASEWMLRRILAASPVGIGLANDRSMLWVNDAWARMFGFADPSECAGQEAGKLYESEEDYMRAGPMLYGDLQSGIVNEIETRMKRTDGSSFDAYIRMTALDPADLGAGQLAVISDISERKASEEALRRSEERLDVALQAADLGLWDIDVRSGKTVINERAAAIAGYTLDEIQPTVSLWDSFCHPDDREQVLRARSAHLGGESPALHEEYRIQTKSGEWKWIQSLGRVVERDEEGNAVRMAGTVRDITGRKNSELAQRRLATAVEQAEEAIVITDIVGTIHYVNPAFEKITGYSKKEALGENPRILKSGDHDQEFYSNLWNTVKQGKVWKGRFINRAKDGRLYKEDATISPVRDRLGRIVNFVAVKRDVTQELALQEQLLQAQKMEAVGTLAGGIAHEFNNLLQVTLGYSDLLLSEKSDDDPEYGDLLKIVQAAGHGRELVRRLLAFSRKLEPRLVRLDLNNEIIRVEELLSRTIPRVISIKLDLSPDLTEINADPGQMEQVVMNLALNARDAMPEGGRLTIATRNVTLDRDFTRTRIGSEPGDYVLLTISDTGQGMDEETVTHIFEPFFTTKEIGRGTGLGLPVVYGIVAQHSGLIECHSKLGRGTSFSIYLPAAEREPEPAAADSQTMPALGSETILLVDDEELVRDLGTRILTKSGYTVLPAANGVEALEVFKRESSRISLVILDLIMPEMDGAACLKALLQIDPRLRVLVASGYSADASVRETLEMGAKGFVNKPFRVKRLLGAVRKALDDV